MPVIRWKVSLDEFRALQHIVQAGTSDPHPGVAGVAQKLLRLLDETPLARASKAPTTKKAAEAALMKAILAVRPDARQHVLVSISQVRRLLVGWPKKTFDRLVLRLAKERRLVLHHHDYPGGLTPEERKALVVDEHGNHYVGLVLECNFADAFTKVFERLSAKTRGTAAGVPLAKLRKALPLCDRATFDTKLLELVRARTFALRAGDERRLTAAEREAAIEERGEIFVAVARPTTGPASSTKRAASSTITPSAFVSDVYTAARASTEGWWDETRVFISHVWKRLREMPAYKSMSLDVFKRRLLELNRTHAVSLGRAEMPQLMDPTDLRESHIEDRDFVFVFLKVPR